jgi:hypothetical protein
MSKIFTIRAGDRLPWLAYEFGFSLEDAVAVTFSAREEPASTVFIDRQPAIIADGTYVINGASRVLTPADGIVFYPWGAGDTATPRKSVQCLFHITWPGALQETLPSDGYERMVISENF